VNATTVTAFYAAVVSTAALGFHGFQWWHGARTKVVLSAEFEVWRSGSQSLDSGVLVKVVNHSRHGDLGFGRTRIMGGPDAPCEEPVRTR
jgi:hypothetical protein